MGGDGTTSERFVLSLAIKLAVDLSHRLPQLPFCKKKKKVLLLHVLQMQSSLSGQEIVSERGGSAFLRSEPPSIRTSLVTPQALFHAFHACCNTGR